MDIKALKKPLDIADVDFRVQSINGGKYATILAYKDARVDMNRLDDVCGGLWQKDYRIIDGKLFCGVGIKIGDEWVWKWDVGTESNSDKEKGQASDAFKRACFNWGIGRELYNYPVISIQLLAHEVTEFNGKYKASFGLKLKEWKWNAEFKGNDISNLTAIDDNGKTRFTWTSKDNTVKQQYYQPETESSEDKLNRCQTIQELGVTFKSLSLDEQKRTTPLTNQLKEKLTPKNN